MVSFLSYSHSFTHSHTHTCSKPDTAQRCGRRRFCCCCLAFNCTLETRLAFRIIRLIELKTRHSLAVYHHQSFALAIAFYLSWSISLTALPIALDVFLCPNLDHSFWSPTTQSTSLNLLRPNVIPSPIVFVWVVLCVFLSTLRHAFFMICKQKTTTTMTGTSSFKTIDGGEINEGGEINKITWHNSFIVCYAKNSVQKRVKKKNARVALYINFCWFRLWYAQASDFV